MKKILALCLALMMLALPVLSFAEETEALSFIEQATANGRMATWEVTFAMAPITGDEQVDALITELLGSLAIKGYHQGGDAAQGGFQINLSGNDILSIEAAMDGEDIYLLSDLLANKTVVAAPDEFQAIAEKAVNALQALGVIDEATAKEIIDNMGESFSAAAETASTAVAGANVEINAEDFDFSGFEALMESIAAKAVQADLAGQPEGSDPAVIATTIPLSADDIVAVYEQLWAMVKSNPAALQSLENVTLTIDNQEYSFEDGVEKMISQLKEQLPAMVDGDILVTVYYDAEDELVAMDAAWTMKSDASEDPTIIDVTMLYTRLTAEDGVNYHFDVNAVNAADESDKVVAVIDFLDQGDDGMASASVEAGENLIDIVVTCVSDEQPTEIKRTVEGKLSVVSDGETFNGKMTIVTTAMTDGTDALETNVVTLSVEDTPVFEITIEEQTGEPVASIATADALRLAELDDAGFQGWLTDVINGLQTWLWTVLQSLPTSVLTLFLGAGM